MRELVSAKKAELEAQLRALSTLDIDALLREREEAAARLAELDERITQVRAQLGLDSDGTGPGDGTHPSLESPTRARMSSEEVQQRIFRVLDEEKTGLSQLQIAGRTSLAYGTVAAYLKTNAERFRITGHLKGKRYFLR